MHNTPTDEVEIDLLRLMKAMLKKLWLIILLAAIGGGLAFSYARFMIKPLYQSEALLYVNNSSISVGSTKVSISPSELSAAQSLVDTYSVILKTRNTLEDVIEQNDLDYTYEELKSMISTSPVNSTEVFGVTVTSHDPQEAEELANAIAKILPEKISNIVEGSSVKIVDYAVIPATKSSPNITKITLIGVMLGALAAMAYIVIHEMMNDEVKEERELRERYGLPVLASIPDLSKDTGGHGAYYMNNSDASQGKDNSDSKKNASK